ncbi:MAG: DUF4202 domain-containing protein [Caldimonas sp.]
MDDPIATARASIDAAHAADRERTGGRPAESVYAERIEVWVRRLVSSPSSALMLAARCQHLERWSIPRSDYPPDRTGYLRWRRAVQLRQGERARALLLGAGVDPALAERVAHLVAKQAPPRDVEAQALEDAACLVFLEHELEAFAAERPDYGRDKWLAILKKTAAKMSPQALAAAVALPLRASLRELLVAALAPTG